MSLDGYRKPDGIAMSHGIILSAFCDDGYARGQITKRRLS